MDASSIQRLLSAAAFPHEITRHELVETHISWVILTGDLAYKIKKPVNFGFVDFSTLARREHFCRREVELNRRYTPEIYLGVVPVTGNLEEPQIDGEGPVIDYAVKMVQFDLDCLLDTVSNSGPMDAALVWAMAAELARTHREFPSLTGATHNPDAMAAAMIQNFDQVRKFHLDAADLALVDVLEAWTCKHIEALGPVMIRRVQEGFVKDLHGDLHLNNMIVRDGRVKFFDCIEFSDDFRLMDTIAEIAFLAMDLAHRQQPAQQVLNDYLEYSGDFDGLQLLNFYRVYFAMVRAKVSLMREPVSRENLHATAAYASFRQFLLLARSFTEQKTPFIAMMHGVAGTGKSTVAALVAAQFGALRLRSDVERKRLFGLSPDDSSEAMEENIYTPAATSDTYLRLQDLCRDIVRQGFPCIVDATFLQRSTRGIFLALGEELGVPVLILDCWASAACIAERLRLREQQQDDVSEAGVDVMQLQLTGSESFSPREQQSVLAIDTEQAFDASLIRRRIR